MNFKPHKSKKFSLVCGRPTCSTRWQQCPQTSPCCSRGSAQSQASEESRHFLIAGKEKLFLLTTRGSIAGRPNSGTPALYLLPMFTKILEHDLYLYFEIVAHDPGTYFSICILKLVSMFSMILEHILYLYFEVVVCVFHDPGTYFGVSPIITIPPLIDGAF